MEYIILVYGNVEIFSCRFNYFFFNIVNFVFFNGVGKIYLLKKMRFCVCRLLGKFFSNVEYYKYILKL